MAIVLQALSLVIALPVQAAELFKLSEVRLLDGPLKRAQDLNGERLLKFDPDRLLAPFRIAAGLEPKAPRYPNWESTGLDGHTAGHYLSALANQYAATGDERFKRRLDAMVDELALCQKTIDTGYVGGIPNGLELWDQVRRGDIRASGFALNDRWVPWYNLHKTFAGLRDAHAVAGNEQARQVLVALADWCEELVAGLSDEQMPDMLRSEHGGMNEVLADVAEITGDERYLRLAERFNHLAILQPLAERQDRLDGLHANTQVPKVIGFAQLGRMTDNADYLTAAEFFWKTVIETRTLAFGGNSIAEHFPSADRSAEWLTHREGPETCNTYNMLRLSEELFRHEPKVRFAEFYERAIYNHILSSQHPEHGGYVYFTPVRPRHYRVYSDQGKCFWCCVGSGMENHTKYGQFIYAHTDDTLYVNLFVPSTLNWSDRGLTLTQDTSFPSEDTISLRVQCETPQQFKLQIRHPYWVEQDAFEVSVNGNRVPEAEASKPSSYFAIDRTWEAGDVITIKVAMGIHFEAMPKVPQYHAILYGPLVLAAPTSGDDLTGLVAGEERMDHIAHGPLMPIDGAPVLVAPEGELAAAVKPVTGEPLTFTVDDAVRPESFEGLRLRPFAQVHDTRYVMYWRTVEPERYESMLAEMKAAEGARLALERRTIDQVTPGQQQPESDHNFNGEQTTAGIWQDHHYRDARGWFSYDLKTAGNTDLVLRVKYFGSDKRTFGILLDDRTFEKVVLEGSRPGEFFDVEYPIPAKLLDSVRDNVLTVKFIALPGSVAGGVFDVRLLKKSEASSSGESDE